MMPGFRIAHGVSPVRCVAFVMAIVLGLAAPSLGFGFSFQQVTSDLYVQPVTMHGYVMTRAQITGPHGGPILVKVRSAGNGSGEATTEEIAEIGEIHPGDAVLSNLYILPGETYRSYQVAWNRIKSERMDVAARAEFLSPQAFAAGAGIPLADGSAWRVPNGYFSPAIKTLVLKAKSERIGSNPDHWILLRVPFKLTDQTLPLEPNVLSVLLDADGKIYRGDDGKAFDLSPPAEDGSAGPRPYNMENFTYRVGYWGVGDEQQQASPGWSNLWGLVGWAPDPAKVQAGEQRIFGPVAGAHMEYFDSEGASDANGYYVVSTQWPCVRKGVPPFHYWVDPVVELNIWMTLQTVSFNPNQSLVQPFMMHQEASFRCGYTEWDAMTHLFLVDAIWLTGKVAVANEGGDLVQISGNSDVEYQAQAPSQNAVAQTSYDFDGDGEPDRAYLANKRTEQDTSVTPARSYVVPVIPQNTATAQWQAVYFSTSAPNRSPSAPALADRIPDLWRLADHAVNDKPAGKLAKISPAALANTDIYVFREGTGELMVEMKGMKRSRNGASLDDVIDSRDNTFYWQTLIRGRAFPSGKGSLFADRTDADFQATNASMGFQSRYQDRQNNTPSPGEWMKVIAINRTTGYVGSRRFQLGMPGDHTGANAVDGVGLYGDLSQYIPQITLRPPRLKVWARRIAPPTGGLRQPGSVPESERTFFIGHEGAATQNDKLVAIYTRWVDWDEDTGTETTLPEGLGINRGADFGLTGRLAKLSEGQLVPVNTGVTVNGDATLQDAAQHPGQVAQFPIGPGEQMQILRLGSDLRVNEHYYINVFGKPVNRAAVECNPCDYDRTGVNPGLLASRPNQYTPFYVPVYDEAATLKLKLERNQLQQANPTTEIGTVDPLYAWVMRPEYQFSLIDLEVSALDAVQHGQGGEEVMRDLLGSDEAKITTGDELVRLMYRLIMNNEPLLPGFDNPATNSAGTRQYVFAFGEEEILLTANEHGQVEIDNLSQIFKLGVEDFLTARIYLNNDPDNLLWQFAYGTVQLVVDRNRNGCLEFTSKTRELSAYRHCGRIQRKNEQGQDEDVEDLTTPEQPFRFWVNDDLDVVRNDGEIDPDKTSCAGEENMPRDRDYFNRQRDEDALFTLNNTDRKQLCEQADEHESGKSNTSSDGLARIETERDLEDFFPIAIRLPDISDNADYNLKWRTTGVYINLFKGDWRDTNGGSAYAYLRDRQVATAQVTLANQEGGVGHVLTAPEPYPQVMSGARLRELMDSQGVIRLMAEATQPTVGPCVASEDGCYLEVELVRTADGESVTLSKSRVHFDFRPVGDFMDYWNAGMVPSESGEHFSPAHPVPIHSNGGRVSTILDDVASPGALRDDYVLFVHGWRMKEQEKQDFAHTAFKRLYWSGYQGRFGFLTWPTGWFEKPDNEYNIVVLAPYLWADFMNYNDSDAVARIVGRLLGVWLEHFKQEQDVRRIHLIAHSMGNVVVSEALRQMPEGVATSYVASQAAEGAGGYSALATEIEHQHHIPGYGRTRFEQAWAAYRTGDHTIYSYPPDLFRDVNVGASGIPHGPTDQEGYAFRHDANGQLTKTYYQGIGGKLDRIVNAHNAGDLALRGWELNQLLKPWPYPDTVVNHAWDYANEGVDCTRDLPLGSNVLISCGVWFLPGQAVHSRYTRDGEDLVWKAGGSILAGNDNHEIITHITPARTHALGQRGDTTGGELGDDPAQIDLRAYDNSNQGHSGQFYSSLAERRDYWEQSLLQGIAFNERTRSVSCLAGWVDAAAGECGRP